MTNPAKSNQLSLLCKLSNEFLVKHSTRITGPTLARDQKSSDNIAFTLDSIISGLISTHEHAACLAAPGGIDSGNSQKAIYDKEGNANDEEFRSGKTIYLVLP